jgi:site-specific recombinase XerD
MTALSLQQVEPEFTSDAQIIHFPKRGNRRTSKGMTYPPNPLTAEDVNLLLETITPQGPSDIHRLAAARLRALIAVVYRSGVRINEALAFVDSDLHRNDSALLVRHGKGDKRRVVMMDQWGWRELETWMAVRRTLPGGYVFPVLRGATAGGRWSDSDVRRQLHHLERESGVGKRVAPHQFRHGPCG